MQLPPEPGTKETNAVLQHDEETRLEPLTTGVRTGANRTSLFPLSLQAECLSWFHHEMAPAVLLKARLRKVVAEGPLFTIGHDGEAITFDPQLHQIISHGLGPLLDEHEVIGRTSSFIAMAFHFQLGHAVCTQPIGIPGKDLSAFLVDRPAIVIKEDIPKARGSCGSLFSSDFLQLPSASGGVGLDQ